MKTSITNLHLNRSQWSKGRCNQAAIHQQPRAPGSIHQHLAATGLALLLGATNAPADGPCVSFTSYTHSGMSSPSGITVGPDGNLWFGSYWNRSIGRITMSGTITMYSSGNIDRPQRIVAGPDGSLWFTSWENNRIGRITTSGDITTYTDTSIRFPYGIAAGPDGALWFINTGNHTVGRITTSGGVSNYSNPGIYEPYNMVPGPDGALWFPANRYGHSVGRVTAGGTITIYTDSNSISWPFAMTAGPDGAIWFSNNGTGAVGDGPSIGRITTNGVASKYPNSDIGIPYDMTVGHDGAMWFTINNRSSIGRITTSGEFSFYTNPHINGPLSLTSGPDGAIWYSNFSGNSIGRMSIDDTPPTISGSPADIVIGTGPGSTTCDQIVPWTPPTASDNCRVDSFTSTHTPGSAFPVGTTPVTYTARDAAGNTATATFTVTVVDDTKPLIAGLPSNITVTTGLGRLTCDQAATWTPPTATDNCAMDTLAPLTSTHTPGSTFPVGTTPVTYTARDAAGNTATATFSVTVVDDTKPVIAACPPAISVPYGSLPIPATTLSEFQGQGGIVTDNCGLATAVTSSDATAGVCPTIVTRTYTIADIHGSLTTCQQVIQVNNLFAPDGVTWHQPLARNGMSDDTDPSGGGTLKYRFKPGSTVPIQIHANGCGGDVTLNARVIGSVEVFGDANMDWVSDGNALVIDYNGQGGAGGLMDKVDGRLKYNLDTKRLPQTTQCYLMRVTVTDTGTGESRSETIALQAK